MLISIIVGIVCLGIGYAINNMLAKTAYGKKVEGLNRQADLVIQEARLTAKRLTDEAELNSAKVTSKAEATNEKIKQDKIKEARERYSAMKLEFDENTANQRIELKELELQVNSIKKEISSKQEDLVKQKDELDQREGEITAIRENLDRQLTIVQKKKDDLDAANEQRIKALEQIAKLSEAQAKEQILEAVKAKTENDALSIIKEGIQNAKLEANKEAKKIVIQTIQRMASEFTIENTVSVFNLDSDELKGQIIGREGRNIRALEAATGAEIVVDDTPEAIVISSFDPIRREICRLALKKLVADGRIHPARIEEVVAKTRKQLEEQIIEIGERTVIDLDVHGLDPYLVKMVGRMRYRSSYGQNLLKHSIETAHLCGVMAAELGLSAKQAKMAKRAGLLHDIGKVSEEETELSHAILGMQLCEKYKEHPAIINAVGAHHDEVEMNNIISPIVQACDSISGARPGARREILESYLKRIGELEELAMSYSGVSKAFAMQAGRELRVIVEAEKVTDDQSDELSFVISQRIQEEMQYPGQIKVTVIREKRAVSYAK